MTTIIYPESIKNYIQLINQYKDKPEIAIATIYQDGYDGSNSRRVIIKMFNKNGVIEVKISKGKKFIIDKERMLNLEKVEVYG